jgi:hypothetical protein
MSEMIDTDGIRVGLTFLGVFYGALLLELIGYRLWQWLRGDTVQIVEVRDHAKRD